MAEVEDDLQSFIADCEWKTRKILRESNQRMKDNARTLAAKERVEKLKHGSVKKASTPLAKSKSLNRPMQSATPPTVKKSATPVKQWKERDKIIHDACETIKALPASDKSSLKAVIAARKENQQAEKPIHSSLSASPFHHGVLKRTPSSNAKAKVETRRTAAGGDSDDDAAKSAEPAMITRRTIERDFYIMSKKRNNPTSKRRQRKMEEPTTELKTSVLRKKYRCDERIMKSKRKQSERLVEKFQRLTIPTDEADGIMDEVDDGESSGSDSSDSSDEEDYERAHAIHDLLERHISDENARSLKRSNKMLMNSNVQLDVKEFWAHLQNGNGGPSMPCRNGQVPSVPLHIATQKFLSAEETVGRNQSSSQPTPSIELGPNIRYTCPYTEPTGVEMQLLVNEPLPVDGRAVPLSVSVSIVRSGASQIRCWLYAIYDPCDGSTRNFTLSEGDFDAMNKVLQSLLPTEARIVPSVIVVHHQTTDFSGVECTYAVSVMSNDTGIRAKVYRTSDRISDGLESICVEENLVSILQASEVMQLLRKHHVYSAFDAEFWLKDSNGAAIWQPLIQILNDNTATSVESVGSILSAARKASDSVSALRAQLRKSPSDGLTKFVSMIEQQSSIGLHDSSAADMHAAPLSMRITGCSPYSKTICPGHAAVGKRGVWRLFEPLVDDNPDPMFPIWPSSMDIKFPESFDKSQASAFFQYKSLGAQKGDCITALTSLAFESPILAPYCFTFDKGYISPPFAEDETVDGTIPYVHLPCTSLMENPLRSRFDTLLPPPVVVLDPGASEDDWRDAPTDAEGRVYHLRSCEEFDEDGFRVKTYANRVDCDDTISSTVYGISEAAASPNIPTITPFITHKSDEACTRYLSRRRNATDYHYIAESDGEGTHNEPYLFVSHMSAYGSVYVSRTSVRSYREQERFIRAAREAERKKLELALKMKVAEELVEKRLKERMDRIEASITRADETAEEGADDACSVSVEVSAGGPSLPAPDAKVPCDVDLPAPPSEGDELEHLAGLLLKNTNFLKAIARKLSIPEEQVMEIDAKSDEGDSKGVVLQDAIIGGGEEIASPSKAAVTAEAPVRIEMPKLKLNCKRYRDTDSVSSRGDGWKRLARSETIIGDFSLTKRNTQKGSGRPKFKKLQENRNFIAVDSVLELQHKTDPELFATEPKSIFIPDLTTERLQLAKTYRQQKKFKESLLSVSQQQSLDEILQIPVSKASEKTIKDVSRGTVSSSEAHADDEHDEVAPNEDNLASSSDQATRAILAVKNHNLAELEKVIDAQGLSVQTRDQHGNSLFILACQQGSKKLAKFLLRRGADINAQNNGGNAALHYLYEYKHTSLAEYLIRKGADDSLVNSFGLTVYEGTSGAS